MKRSLLSFMLAVCLLVTCCPAAYAAAGSPDDPLISKSYSESWASGLLTDLIAKAKSRIDSAWAELNTDHDSTDPYALPTGSVITMEQGACITVISGTARVDITKGSFINTTVGGAAVSGRVIPGHKYIVCEDSTVTVTITGDARCVLEGDCKVSPAEGTVLTPSPIPAATPTPTPSPTPTPTAVPTATVTPTPTAQPAVTPTPVVIVIEPTPIIIYVTVTPTPTPTPTAAPTATPTPVTTVVPASPSVGTVIAFKDVSASAPFYDDLQFVLRKSLMSGVSSTEFAPAQELTIAEAIALTASMHQLNEEGKITLKKGFWLWWCNPYRKYASEHELIDDSYARLSRKKLNAPITKGALIEMLYKAMPADSFEAINQIPDNAIPDVKDFSSGADVIYTLYRAGVLTGYLDTEGVEDHTFKAHESATRAEAAVIAARMMDPDRRVEFTMEE